MKTGYTLLMKF